MGAPSSLKSGPAAADPIALADGNSALVRCPRPRIYIPWFHGFFTNPKPANKIIIPDGLLVPGKARKIGDYAPVRSL